MKQFRSDVLHGPVEMHDALRNILHRNIKDFIISTYQYSSAVSVFLHNQHKNKSETVEEAINRNIDGFAANYTDLILHFLSSLNDHELTEVLLEKSQSFVLRVMAAMLQRYSTMKNLPLGVWEIQMIEVHPMLHDYDVILDKNTDVIIMLHSDELAFGIALCIIKHSNAIHLMYGDGSVYRTYGENYCNITLEGKKKYRVKDLDRALCSHSLLEVETILQQESVANAGMTPWDVAFLFT